MSTNLDNDQNTPERVRANFDSSIKSNNSITNVLQVISGICKDNKNKLNSNVISHMFCVLSNLIDTSKLNKDMIKTKDLFSVIRDVIKLTDKLETFVYNRMFDCLIKVEQLNLNNTADKTEILFKLIQQFWEKDSDIFNNGLIEYIFDTLNELSNEKCDDNKVSLIKAVDIFNLICAIQKKKGKALTKSVILSMFRTLENAIELGSIENLTTENVFNLIDDILKCRQINDAIGNLFAVLDKLNRKKYKLKQKQNAKAIDIFKSIDYWCREKIMGLMGIIILPIFQALEKYNDDLRCRWI